MTGRVPGVVGGVPGVVQLGGSLEGAYRVLTQPSDFEAYLWNI